MDIRSALSTLFFVGGGLFFILAAANLWEPNRSGKSIPLNEITSTPDVEVDLQHLTAQPLVGNSISELQDTDVLALVSIPVNYGCGICSQRATAFVKGLDKHPVFEDLSTETSRIIVGSDHRTATHFARVQQLGVPAFQLTKVPTANQDVAAGRCFALLVNPQTEKAFFKVHLSRAPVSVQSDAVFEAAREAYRQRTRTLSRR